MAKYRVAFDNKEIRSIHKADGDRAGNEPVSEERTGNTLYATIEASSDEEAREKAQRLQVELQTGKTKKQLGHERGGERSHGPEPRG